jgi:hypothetical protein
VGTAADDNYWSASLGVSIGAMWISSGFSVHFFTAGMKRV